MKIPSTYNITSASEIWYCEPAPPIFRVDHREPQQKCCDAKLTQCTVSGLGEPVDFYVAPKSLTTQISEEVYDFLRQYEKPACSDESLKRLKEFQETSPEGYKQGVATFIKMFTPFEKIYEKTLPFSLWKSCLEFWKSFCNFSPRESHYSMRTQVGMGLFPNERLTEDEKQQKIDKLMTFADRDGFLRPKGVENYFKQVHTENNQDDEEGSLFNIPSAEASETSQCAAKNEFEKLFELTGGKLSRKDLDIYMDAGLEPFLTPEKLLPKVRDIKEQLAS